jgi:chromosome condensin MukBEF complex kleisin-like MukF subunit
LEGLQLGVSLSLMARTTMAKISDSKNNDGKEHRWKRSVMARTTMEKINDGKEQQWKRSAMAKNSDGKNIEIAK